MSSSAAQWDRLACCSNPWVRLRFAEARAAYREQIEALVEQGVDLLVFETFLHVNELREALTAARDVAGRDTVLVAQMTIDDDGNLFDGTSTATFHRVPGSVAGRRDRPELLGRP